jgi:hypothetical protein
MRVAALALAFALSACAFSSEQPLFDASEAAQPIADGAHFLWRDPDSDNAPKEVVYHRDGAFYEIAPSDQGDEPMQVLFVPLPGGPPDDYIAQVRMKDDESARAYAYMVRDGARWLIFANPNALDDDGEGQAVRARYCTTLSYGECRFENRAAALAVFRGYVAHHVADDAAARAAILVQEPVSEQSGPSP